MRDREYFDKVNSIPWSLVLSKIKIIGKKKENKRTIRIKCLFHTENTASLVFVKDKAIFQCHGCGIGGDIFKFIELHEAGRKMAMRFFRRNFGIKP